MNLESARADVVRIVGVMAAAMVPLITLLSFANSIETHTPWIVDDRIMYSILGLIGLVGTFAWQQHRQKMNVEGKIAQNSEKMDVIIDFLMRRSLSEAVYRGFGAASYQALSTAESNLAESTHGAKIILSTISPGLRRLYAPLMVSLKAFYDETGHELSDRDLFVKIETLFGQQLLDEICIPQGIYSGACIIIAATLMKEEENQL